MEVEEILVEYLSVEDQKTFEDVHLFDKGFACSNNADRELVGWYNRKNLRVAFYYEPSWWSKKKMYWIYGWEWEPKNKD